MRLIDRILNLRTILILVAVLTAIAISFTGLRIYQNHMYDLDKQAEKDRFFSLLAESSYDEAKELWPFVYTYFKNDDKFKYEFQDVLSDIYIEYYINVYISPAKDEDAYEICRVYYSFLGTDEFEMIVSSVYEDFLYERIDYHNFLGAVNDFYLFSMYDSPRIIEILDTAGSILYSRESYYRAESKQRTGDYQEAIELYKNVPAIDVMYYPGALENIDKCIELLREQVRNGE